MNPEHLRVAKHIAQLTMTELSRGFDIVASWVVQLSWIRFSVYAIIALISGGILQDTLFSGDTVEERTVTQHKKPKKKEKVDLTVHIDENGINIKQAPPQASPPVIITPKPAPPLPQDPVPPPSVPATIPGTLNSNQDIANTAIQAANEAAESAREATEALQSAIKQFNEISEKASKEAEDEAMATVAEEVTKYKQESSSWFKKFVFLIILTLFGTKALMGSKKRADAQAMAAKTAAEREALNRQVSEAKMQMMQAQVEPHFLFNTLASVEFLIETDPPRAASMQRSLIKYLRAVLPQIREMTPSTNLGRETDMATAYLDLLKMRMEERLTVELDIDPSLRSAAFPPMMLQPLVENAIKHGLECKEEGGTLTISVKVADTKLRVMVSDDGVGFGVQPSDGTGLGLTSIRERLSLLYGSEAQLIIEPNHPSGVISIIEVPYQKSN
jgi:Histidine kinase